MKVSCRKDITYFILVLIHFSFGAKYSYNATNQTFEFYEGEPCCFDPADPSSQIDIEVDYPKTIYLVDGHPEVFSANGSHGTWGSAGRLKTIEYYCNA